MMQYTISVLHISPTVRLLWPTWWWIHTNQPLFESAHRKLSNTTPIQLNLLYVTKSTHKDHNPNTTLILTPKLSFNRPSTINIPNNIGRCERSLDSHYQHHQRPGFCWSLFIQGLTMRQATCIDSFICIIFTQKLEHCGWECLVVNTWPLSTLQKQLLASFHTMPIPKLSNFKVY